MGRTDPFLSTMRTSGTLQNRRPGVRVPPPLLPRRVEAIPDREPRGCPAREGAPLSSVRDGYGPQPLARRDVARLYVPVITTGSGGRGGNGVRSSGDGPKPVKVQLVPFASALAMIPRFTGSSTTAVLPST